MSDKSLDIVASETEQVFARGVKNVEELRTEMKKVPDGVKVYFRAKGGKINFNTQPAAEVYLSS